MRVEFDQHGRRFARLTTWVLVSMLAFGCVAHRHTQSGTTAAGGPADRPATEARITDYLRKTAALPPGTTLQISDWGAADMPGWSKATVQVSSGNRSQQVAVVVSNDGHYMIRGEVVDLTVDPLKAIRDKIDLKGQPVRGAADAPVIIVEYSDSQCPFCARASQTVEHDLLAAYPGKVKLVHKNFPLTQIHPWAQNAALFAECALLQNNDGYWKLYELFFQQQKTLTPANLKEKVLEAAGAAGLDRQKLADCFDSKATAAQVQADVGEGTALGVNSTPMFFVNGHRLSGAQPAEAFRAIIDQELAQH